MAGAAPCSRIAYCREVLWLRQLVGDWPSLRIWPHYHHTGPIEQPLTRTWVACSLPHEH